MALYTVKMKVTTIFSIESEGDNKEDAIERAQQQEMDFWNEVDPWEEYKAERKK